MRCRECGLELDERDRLRNGAYQCPECGTIYHTASSSKASPSPWRSQRRRRPATVADVLQRRLWVLPLWSWAAIVLAVLVAVILLLTLGGHKAAPANPDAPSPDDAALTETQESPEGTVPEEEENAGDAEETAPIVTEAVDTAGHTDMTANDFLVSFDWVMGNMKYTSSLSPATEGTNTNGEQTLSYNFEDWFNVVLTIDTESSAIRYAIATVSADVSKADNQKMLGGFVAMMYCFDTSLTASKALSELNGMIADNMRTYGTSSFVAKVNTSDPTGYTMEIGGKL